MRGRSVAVAACAAALLSAAVPGAASGRTFRGETSQSRSASLVTGADGVPVRVRVPWSAKCDHGRFSSTTTFVSLSTATRTRVRDTATYVVRGKGTLRSSVTAVLRLQRVLAGGHARWSGTFIPRVTVRRSGRTIDHCRSAPIGLRVS